MKNIKETEKAFQVLLENIETPEEAKVIEDCIQKLTALPFVEVLDENHQRFNGKIYKRINSPQKARKKYYRHCNDLLHREVWKFFHGEIPRGYAIHHKDFNPDNNNIENLQLITFSEHQKIHSAQKMKDKICKSCGQHFMSKGSAFCSPSCYAKFFNAGLAENANYIVKICRHCGKEFVTPKKSPERAKYCSRRCLMLARHERKRQALSDKTLICKNCGKEFPATEPHHKFFCSEKCWRHYQYLNLREERTCAICGKTFNAFKHSKTKTCSHSCGAKYAAKTADHFIAK